MFKLFNRENTPRIVDRVFMHTKNKWQYCQKLFAENSKTIFIGWFDETIGELENYFSHTLLSVSVVNARTIGRSQVSHCPVIFIEHHPIRKKEQQVLSELGLNEAIFLTALDEPLLRYFGGEKLMSIMEKLGMSEDEAIEHKMITQSIATAQEKIESKVSFEQSTRSQREWMERNIK